MDGWAVLTALKADPMLADIPVVILSIIDDVNMGFALGATDYLIKPIDRQRLVSVLEKHRQHRASGTILIVEDDPAVREMLRRILERDGWTIDEAANGIEGLARVAAAPPALILLDLMMPEMDGFTFLRELRGKAGGRDIPVVVLTAKTLTGQERLMLGEAVDHVLQKGSYKRDDLLNEVREQVAAHVKGK